MAHNAALQARHTINHISSPGDQQGANRLSKHAVNSGKHLSISAEPGHMVAGKPQAPLALDDTGCILAPPVVLPQSPQIVVVPVFGLRLLLQLMVLLRCGR